MWTIVYVAGHGWCVIDFHTPYKIISEHRTHQEAVQAIETMAHRIAQGWAP